MKNAIAARRKPTERQLQILRLKANGYTFKEIAKMPHIQVSVHGAQAALWRVYRKYGVNSDIHAVAVALKLGDITFDDIVVPLPGARKETP